MSAIKLSYKPNNDYMKRDKHRYLLVKTSSDIRNNISFEQNLYKNMIDVVGQINFHKLNPKIIEIIDKNHFIIRVGLLGYKESILAFALIKKLDEERISFYTLKSSGTLKALRSKTKTLNGSDDAAQ